MAKTRKRKSTKATAKAKVVRTKAAKKARKTKAPGRDEKGPLGWLIPDLETAYARLTPREAEGGVRAMAEAADVVRVRSSIATGADAVYAPVNKGMWRDLIHEYKQRKAGAAHDRAAARAAIVPGGRNWLPLGPSLVLNGQ